MMNTYKTELLLCIILNFFAFLIVLIALFTINSRLEELGAICETLQKAITYHQVQLTQILGMISKLW